MKVRNYIDNMYYVLGSVYFIICFVCAGLVIVLNASMFYLTIGISCLVIIAVLAFLFYDRTYYFDKKEFRIRVGFFIKRFKYKDIKKSYITTNNRLSYATSRKRIAIKFKGRKGKEIYISPLKMDEVLLKLINNTGGK